MRTHPPIRARRLSWLLLVMGTAVAAQAASGEDSVTPAGAPVQTQAPASEPAPSATPATGSPPPSTAQPVAEPAAGGRTAPYLIRGNDQVVAAPLKATPASGSRASLRFENSPVADVVHVVMREMAKVDYVLYPPVAGNVTLSTQGAVSTDQALYLLESALQANGLLMLRDPRGTYHIGRPEALRNIVPGVRQAGNGPLPPGNGAVVVQLQYIGAAEMAAILRPLLPPDGLVRVDPLRNLLVLAGTRTQAEGWLDLVRTFDVNMLKGMSVGVFPLRYISTRDVETAVRLISSSLTSPTPMVGQSASTGSGPGLGAAASAATTTPGVTASGLDLPTTSGLGAIRVLPVERLNSVIVVAPRAAYLDEARSWIEKLDQPGLADRTESQLFVYPVQNGNATHLANVLNGLFGNLASAAPVAADNGTAPGLRAATASSGALNGGAAGTTTAGTANKIDPSAGTRANTGGSPTITTVALPSGLRIIADSLNNAVLVYGSQQEYRKIESTLRRLDTPAAQVLIEASIMEVTLTDELQYGLQWNFSDQQGSSTGLGQLLDGSGLGALTKGFTYTLSNSAGGVRAVLKALADKSLVRVISSPSLMVLDNHTASISVGNQQPIRSSQTVTDGGTVTSSIQYKDTGVSLSVTPQVNAGNMVTMQLNQAVTDVGSVDSATGQRAFLQRQVGSKVAVRSGESLVLGGLIRDNDTNGKSGVPGLKDIPLFGALFGTHTNTSNRTELLVVITPRILRSDDELRAVSTELRERMHKVQDLAQEQKEAQPASPGTPADTLFLNGESRP